MSNPWLAALIIFAVTAIAATLATRLVLPMLQRRAILDHPNERSSHARPTPRGGGIAVIAVAALAWLTLAVLWTPHSIVHWLVIGGMIALASLSWFDDLRGLSAGFRIVCHAIVVGIVLAAVPSSALVFQGWLPPLLDRIAAALLWIWFINLFNFMDGIDGISGVETIAIGVGLFLLTMLAGDAPSDGLPALTLAGAAAGFLVWNWHPARLFLGDVGSVPLGFALGWLLLTAAMAGHWAAASILPLYYLADATITLAKRALRGVKVWEAHREHFYQQAVARGHSHAAVSRAIALANLLLMLLALVAERSSTVVKFGVLAAALGLVALLLLHFSGALRRARI